MQLNLILGPPGTGKTTSLLSIVKMHMEQGAPSRKIAFVSFTRKAAYEAADRVKLDRDERPYFCTLHSLAYRCLALTRDSVMGNNDYKQIAKSLGVAFKGFYDASQGPVSETDMVGDAMLYMVGLAGATKKDLYDVWKDNDRVIEWHRLKQFDDTIRQYKNDLLKIDYNDMLDIATQQRLTVDVDVAIIDEAQDLSNVQWDFVKSIFRKAKHIYVAGDDDQAIFEWSGANVNRFISIGFDHTKVLDTTYRLPFSIYNMAITLSLKIKNRYKKEWHCYQYKPYEYRTGSVNLLNSIKDIKINPDETYFMLARNSYMLDDYKTYCEENGILYSTVKGSSINADHLTAIVAWEALRQGKKITKEENKMILKYAGASSAVTWHEVLTGIPTLQREYYLSIERRGTKLTDLSKVHIGTIHSVKGGEADNVVIMSDISNRSYVGMEKNPDAEHRVFYVGITRAKENLHIISPQTTKAFKL